MSALPSPRDDGTRGALFEEIWALFDRGSLISQCAWCGNVDLEGAWVPAPASALVAVDARLTVSHSICPSCLIAQMSKFTAVATD